MALNVRSTIQLVPQLLQVLQNVRQDSRSSAKWRTGNRGGCKRSERWHESSTKPGREECVRVLRQFT